MKMIIPFQTNSNSLSGSEAAMRKNIIGCIIFLLLIIISQSNCTPSIHKMNAVLRENNMDFLQKDTYPNEAYRVLITSDNYIISQMNFNDTLVREEDSEGDKYICDKLRQFDKVDIMREAAISLNLYPDSGKLMKIRPKTLTYIMEIDNLIVEDIKRWRLQFKEGTVSSNIVDVSYRIILRKKQTDEEIMVEVREKVREEEDKKNREEERERLRKREKL